MGIGLPAAIERAGDLARQRDLRTVSFSTHRWWVGTRTLTAGVWTYQNPAMAVVGTFSPQRTFNLTQLRVLRTQNPWAYWMTTIIGFSDNPAAYSNPGSIGTTIWRSTTEGYIAPSEAEFINFAPNGFYLPVGKNIYILELMTPKYSVDTNRDGYADYGAIYHGSEVTLYMNETFEQA